MSRQVKNLGGKTSERSAPDTIKHTWHQHHPVVPWTWITWQRGSLSGFSTNSYYFLFSTHSLIRRESFLLPSLFLWHHLAACGILVPRAETSTLAAGGPLDFLQQGALWVLEEKGWSLASSQRQQCVPEPQQAQASFCSTLRHLSTRWAASTPRRPP